MAKFPSLEWCQALVSVLEKDPEIAPAVREWAGKSIGVVIGKDAGLAKDFCVYAKPDAKAPKLLELRLCEDEDDLELEEPDYLFRAPFGVVKQLLEKRFDPLEALRKGQVRVAGDIGALIPFGQKYRAIGERAAAAVPTTY
jgi:hypothetical protein